MTISISAQASSTAERFQSHMNFLASDLLEGRDTGKDHGMKLIPDPMPEQGIFVRSDQYSFVKKGIPAVYLVTADKVDMVFEKHEISSQEFITKHYHRPSDQLHLPINYDIAAKFVAINLAIALQVANQTERPTWNKDSFFATIKEQ